MNPPAHLLVAFSDHGFGHIAQAAPVVNALWRRFPRLRVTVCSQAPRAFLAARLQGAFDRIRSDTGPGMVMADATQVQPEASLRAYAALHQGWDARVAAEADHYRGLGVAAVLADVPYLPLAAAARAGLPAVALCSFSWHDIFDHYVGAQPGAAPILAQIRAAYQGARCFIKCAPAVPDPGWLAARHVGPIAAVGQRRRAELDRRPDLGTRGRRLVVVSLGGIATPVHLGRWPRLPGVRWIVQTAAEAARHPDALSQADLGLGFADLLASADAVITKPGYATFVEAAVLGLPVLYVARPDWPEEPGLSGWLARHTRARAIPAEALDAGALAEPLEALWRQPARRPAAPTGVEEAADAFWDAVCR